MNCGICNSEVSINMGNGYFACTKCNKSVKTKLKCDSCESERVATVEGDITNGFRLTIKEENFTEYVPRDIGFGIDGNYMKFKYCLNCGKIQGIFPVSDPDSENQDEGDYEEDESEDN